MQPQHQPKINIIQHHADLYGLLAQLGRLLNRARKLEEAGEHLAATRNDVRDAAEEASLAAGTQLERKRKLGRAHTHSPVVRPARRCSCNIVWVGLHPVQVCLVIL